MELWLEPLMATGAGALGIYLIFLSRRKRKETQELLVKMMHATGAISGDYTPMKRKPIAYMASWKAPKDERYVEDGGE